MNDRRQSNGRRVWTIVAVALLMRAALLASAMNGPQSVFTPDSHSYWRLAESIRSGSFVIDGQPEIFRTPGYPAFVAAGRLIDGWPIVVSAQVLLDTLLVLLTFHLAGMLAGRQAGPLAATFQAITPVAVAASCRMLSDSLYALLLTGAIALLVAHFRGGKWKWLLAAAATMAAACYVRPIGVATAAVAGVVVLFGCRSIRRAGAFAAVVAVCLAPWVVRNAIAADYYGFSSFAGDSMYRFSAAEVIARRDGTDPASERRRLDAKVAAADLADTPGARSRYRSRQAMQIIGRDLGGHLAIHLKGAAAFWLPGATDVLEVAGATVGQRGTLAVLHAHGPVAAAKHYFADSPWAIVPAAVMIGVFAVKMFGVVVCVLSRARPRAPAPVGGSASAWLLVLIVLISALAGGPASTPRFRVAVAPLLSVAAAVGWLRLSARRRRGSGQEPSPLDPADRPT